MSEIQISALTRILDDDNETPPYGCSECPFAANPDGVNYADPDEGYYDCTLLGRDRVWGESPVCSDRDWKAKARQELDGLMRNAEPD